MRWANLLLFLQLSMVGFFLTLCVGCGSLLAPFLEKNPSATGVWTGQLRSVAVYDVDGREYQVAALDIETGPRTLRGDTGTIRLGHGTDLALLSPGGQGVLGAERLGVSPGSRVRVNGLMLMVSALAPIGSLNDNVVKGISLQSPWRAGTELVIQMRGKPTVLGN